MKRAIVIGATSGIGRGLAEILAENNFQVGITGRRINLLHDLKENNLENIFIKAFDISETDTVQDHLSELVKDMGGLDLLIISSGTGDLNENLSFKIEKRTIDTNVSGFTAVADWALSFFIEQKSGHLVAITSVAGLRGSRHAPSYYASKAYQINYLEGLRQKAAKTKDLIFITDVRPGLVDTEMAKGDGLFWVSDVDKAAKQIFKAVSAKKKVVYVTKRWRIIAGILEVLPDWIYNKLP
jgi:short-subunit dehydrogenase